MMRILCILQEILNVLDFQMSLEELSKKSRIHFQHLPDILFHEDLKNNLVQSLKTNKKLINRKLGEIHSILLKTDKDYSSKLFGRCNRENAQLRGSDWKLHGPRQGGILLGR